MLTIAKTKESLEWIILNLQRNNRCLINSTLNVTAFITYWSNISSYTANL